MHFHLGPPCDEPDKPLEVDMTAPESEDTSKAAQERGAPVRGVRFIFIGETTMVRAEQLQVIV